MITRIGFGGGCISFRELETLSNVDAVELCKKIGSDAPFFINGGLQYLEGRGAELRQVPPYFKDYTFLVIYPNIKISTSWAYGQYKIHLDNQSAYNKFGPLQIPIDWDSFYNDFDRVVLSAYPKIRCIKQKLNKFNCLLSNLSGSGSAVFGIFKDKDLAIEAQSEFSQYQTHISSPVYR